MKNKKTVQVKKKKKVEVNFDETKSIIELAKLEEKAPPETYNKPDGSGRKYTRQVFALWCTLPDIFKGMPQRITELLGITDPVTLEVLAIKSMTDFAEIFKCSVNSLTRWRREVENDDNYFTEVKRQFKPLTRNLVAALYRKAIEEGDAQRFKVYMQIIEGWREQLGIDHSGSVVEGLTNEERGALDNLISKNTKT